MEEVLIVILNSSSAKNWVCETCLSAGGRKNQRQQCHITIYIDVPDYVGRLPQNLAKKKDLRYVFNLDQCASLAPSYMRPVIARDLVPATKQSEVLNS